MLLAFTSIVLLSCSFFRPRFGVKKKPATDQGGKVRTAMSYIELNTMVDWLGRQFCVGMLRIPISIWQLIKFVSIGGPKFIFPTLLKSQLIGFYLLDFSPIVFPLNC